VLEFHDAGHALGSAGIMVRGRQQSLFYTGDVSFRDQTILKGARFDDVQADVLIMETTRGNRAVAAGFNRDAEIDRLTEALHQVLARKGCVLIPTFALGRTQEILALLALLMNTGRLQPQPIYIGGLGRVFTEIYDLQSHRTHRQHQSLRLTEALNLIVLDKGQIEKMKLSGGRIFVVTAGMMSENTAAHDLAVRMIGDERQAIFFVGYADPETPGGRLKAAAMGETFHFSQTGGQVTRRCEIQDFDLTAHANRDELVEFVDQVSPRTAILGHGDPDSRQWIADELRRRHPKLKILQPGPGESLEV
jgi:Cft2 family RNA processing exonuclease